MATETGCSVCGRPIKCFGLRLFWLFFLRWPVKEEWRREGWASSLEAEGIVSKGSGARQELFKRPGRFWKSGPQLEAFA